MKTLPEINDSQTVQGSETPATMGVVSEQTGLLPCPFCGLRPEPCADDWHIEHARGCILFGIPELRHLRTLVFWNKRAASQSTPSQTPAAPSRKQKGTYDPGAIHRELEYFRGIVEQLVDSGILNKELIKNRKPIFDAAARVEPTKTVILGFASWADGRFELIIRDNETCDETTLHGQLEPNQFEEVSKVLPPCVMVAASCAVKEEEEEKEIS